MDDKMKSYFDKLLLEKEMNEMGTDFASPDDRQSAMYSALQGEMQGMMPDSQKIPMEPINDIVEADNAPNDQDRLKEMVKEYIKMRQEPQRFQDGGLSMEEKREKALQELENYKPKEQKLETGDYLPDVFAGLHNVINYAQGSQQPNLKLNSIESAKKAFEKQEKERKENIEKKFKLYNDFIKEKSKKSEKGITKLQEERQKNIADRYDELQTQVPNALSSINEANFLIEEIKKGNLSTGPGAKLAGEAGAFFGTEESTLKQRLDSLAEKAARAQLKANGEVRPTDADVEGMKRALFNLGNTEEANLEKLQQFIKQQQASVNEYTQMRNALKSGQGLENFLLDPTYDPKVNISEKSVDSKREVAKIGNKEVPVGSVVRLKGNTYRVLDKEGNLEMIK